MKWFLIVGGTVVVAVGTTLLVVLAKQKEAAAATSASSNLEGSVSFGPVKVYNPNTGVTAITDPDTGRTTYSRDVETEYQELATIGGDDFALVGG